MLVRRNFEYSKYTQWNNMSLTTTYLKYLWTTLKPTKLYLTIGDTLTVPEIIIYILLFLHFPIQCHIKLIISNVSD